MPKKNIPTPICSTCKESGSASYSGDDTTYLCSNCGTEMRFLPAGELLTTSGSAVKKNNGWITTFSMVSSDLYSGRAMFAIGLLFVVLVLSFLYLGKLETDAALWSAGPGILLVVLGKRKTLRQQKKMKEAAGQYPYWENCGG